MSDLRRLPRIDTLSEAGGLQGYPRRVRVQAARAVVERARVGLAGGQAIVGMDFEALATQEAERLQAVSLRPAVNLSGVILHTGLGRARLAPSAAAAVAQVAASHSTLEFDLESGERGERQDHVRGLLRKLTGAEDALVVNNAAAGVVLALSALAQGREVILSRGQMVEIGGSFRMPEIVKQSGCQLVEVGCTNKTHLSDYKKAFSEETAAILRCHPSNFQIVGFTEQPPLSDLVALASEHGALCIDDMGTGCLVDTTAFGLPKQTTIPEAVAAGAHLVIASGDKLLGGPQAGIILGKAELVQQLKSHPLARALRADKLCLAALEATLRLYSTGREMEIPCLGYLARPLAQVKRAAQQLARAYPGMARIKPTTTQVGGGCAPGAGVPSFAAVLQTEKAADLAARLRAHRPPIVGRVQDGAVWLDPRTAEADEVRLVAKALKELGS